MSRLLRLVAALLLIAIAVVHLYLYEAKTYNRIPTVGWLFLLTVISGFLLAIAEIVRPSWMVDVSGALFGAGVLGAYLLTLWLPMGLFKFKEPSVSTEGVIAIIAEVGVFLVAGFSALRSLRSSHAAIRPQPTGG